MQKTTNNLFSKQLKRLRKTILLSAYLLTSTLLLNAQGIDPHYIKADDAIASQQFGHEVSISGDFMAVSSSNMGLYSTSGVDVNAVYIYKKTAEGHWSQIQKIDGPFDSFNTGGFGYSISMSEDRLAIGCIYYNDVGQDGKTGLVYIYKKDEEDQWSLQQTLTPDLDQEGDMFGISVDLNGDDLAIGGRMTINLYTLENDSFVWKTVVGGFSWSYFLGHTVKISGDYMATLQYDYFYNDYDVLVFSATEDGIYQHEGTIQGINGAFMKDIASDVVPSISLNENQLVISSYSANNGAVYLYERDDDANWLFKQQIVPEIEDGELDWFGGSVVLTDKCLVVSGGFTNWNEQQERALWVYQKNDENLWTQKVSLYSGPDCEKWCTGWALDMDEDALAMGSVWDFRDGDFAGQAYVFDLGQYTNVMTPQETYGKLYQNSPNPFIDETSIGFELERASFGKLKILDGSGRILRVVEDEFQAGYNEILVRDLQYSGVLFYTLETTDFIATRRMIKVN